MAISSIRTVAEWLRAAERIVTLSGAGLSKGVRHTNLSGRRGPLEAGEQSRVFAGRRADYRPGRIPRVLVGSPCRPGQRSPNPALEALAALQALEPQLVCVTQNIDGLLTAAGCVNVLELELHGNMNRSRCVSCALDLRSEQSECPNCQALTRPDVVMFGEELPRHILADAERAAKSSEVCLVIGTSGVVYPAAGLAKKAKSRGARLVVINLEPTALDSDADAVLIGPAEGILPQLVSLVEER